MSGVNEIRSSFLQFFAREGHEVAPSSSLVPRNDPTLMFTNAGMVQFKNVFTGVEKRPYVRAATAQKCVRAGGKHNDLDNVGYTARHHTFFEMLGNFSFGDYFKEEAIEFAWRLLTQDFGLPKERLTVTVYTTTIRPPLCGRRSPACPTTASSASDQDNFWAMGDTGPCGPCSEIFFDHGDHIPGGPPGSPDADGDRFVEIWNLVFMQFEGCRTAARRPAAPLDRHRHGARAPRRRHAGRARQLRHRPLSHADSGHRGPHGRRSGRPAARLAPGDRRPPPRLRLPDRRRRLPSNEGRGYVLRRIMRRAMRHAHLLGAREPLMHRLVPALMREMGEAYPELRRAEAVITETLARGGALPPHARPRHGAARGRDAAAG